MGKYISIDKRSKKAQREYYSLSRQTWNGFNPATRTVPNGKAYNRNREKQERRRIGGEFRDEFEADFLLYFPVDKAVVLILTDGCFACQYLLHANVENYLAHLYRKTSSDLIKFI